MAKKPKPPAQLDPGWRNWAAVDPGFLQQMGTPEALAIQGQINALAQADPNLSAGDLTRLLVETLRQQAALRGDRLDSISDQAEVFAEQLARQARGGDVAGVIELPAKQLELAFTPDYSRPAYYNPRPLTEAIDIAADEGVPLGVNVAGAGWGPISGPDWTPTPSVVASNMRREGDEFMRLLRDSLVADGIPGAELVPLSRGAYSTAFSSPLTDEVVKFTFDGPRQYTSEADGVWGVLSPRRVATLPTSYGDFAYSIQPRAELGRATRADHDTLKQALTDQGYRWHDDHMGNMAMLPGNEYRPVVIDSADVHPLRGQGEASAWPFIPPSGPLYNWLIPALAAGGATAVGTLGGQQQAEAGTRGRGVKTWHGSGADFDSLDPEKALSGAGGAIFSPGWYSAESPLTAQSFDNGWMYRFLIDGEPQEFLNWHDSIDNQPEVRDALERAGLPTSNHQSDVVRALVGRFNPSAVGVDNLEALGILSRSLQDYDKPSQANQRLLGAFGLRPTGVSGINGDPLYEVDQGIDFTKDGSRPLVSGRNLLSATDDLRRRVAFSGNDSITPRGEEVWDELSRYFEPAHRRWADGQTTTPPWEVMQRARPQGAAAIAMAEAGIPGIRYLDLASRAPSAATQDYNYVVNYPNTGRIQITDKKRTNYNWLIPALAAGGATAVAALGGQQQAEASEGGEGSAAAPMTMDSQGGLPQPTGQDPFFNPPQRYGYSPVAPAANAMQGVSADGTLTLGQPASAPGAFQLVTSGRSPVQPPAREAADLSMEVSPSEWDSWYDNPESGYGGEEHQQFQAAIERVMDVPAIPERYITERLGATKDMWDKYFPGYQGGDMTPRQLAEGAKWLVILPAMAAATLEANQGIKDGPYANTLLSLTVPGAGEKIAADVAAEFAGLRRNRGNKAAEFAVQKILDGISSGVSGGDFAERDEVARSEDARLRGAFRAEGGDPKTLSESLAGRTTKEGESEFYVTPGGQQNYRREASLQMLRTLQDGQFAPPGMTSLDYIGNRLWDQTIGNIQRLAGEEYNPQDINGFGRADWRADSLMDSSAPRGRMRIALDLYSRTPEWARMSAQQSQERDAQNAQSSQTMRAVNAELERALAGSDGTSPELRAAMLGAGRGMTAASDANAAGYKQINPDAVDRFDQGTGAGLTNVLYNNPSFAPAGGAQWFDPVLGQVNDRATLGIDSGAFSQQMSKDLDSVRRVRGNKESEADFDKRASWHADKKAVDRDERSSYYGPMFADIGNAALGGNPFTGKKFERTFLSPTADFVANLPQDFLRNAYNYPLAIAGGVTGGIAGLARSGISGLFKSGVRGAGRGLLGEMVDEGKEELAMRAGTGLLDFRPQQQNSFAVDVDAPSEKWKDGQPPQLDPNDPDYWKKWQKAKDYHQGRSAGVYESWKRGLLD